MFWRRCRYCFAKTILNSEIRQEETDQFQTRKAQNRIEMGLSVNLLSLFKSINKTLGDSTDLFD